MEGIEPPRLAALEPKSSASTNSATSAILKVNSGRAVNHLLCLYASLIFHFYDEKPDTELFPLNPYIAQ